MNKSETITDNVALAVVGLAFDRLWYARPNEPGGGCGCIDCEKHFPFRELFVRPEFRFENDLVRALLSFRDSSETAHFSISLSNLKASVASRGIAVSVSNLSYSLWNIVEGIVDEIIDPEFPPDAQVDNDDF
jgi:hypothetical protein